MEDYAIRVKDVSKMYKLFDNNKMRIVDALGLTRKQLYKEHYALHHMNFDVKKGETVGLIGTNGAGKSTILKIITGVLHPTLGDVEIQGRISALLELGAGFNMEFTGIENIYLNGTMIGFSKEEIDAKLDDILKFADIGDFVYQPVKTYSSGMFVRLAFAVAINIDPEILIVDEALSVGDVFFQAKCYKKFEEFKAMGKTILFVSHDLSSITRYCDRVILLDKGRKLAEGTPGDMVNLYKRVLAQAKDNNGAEKNGVTYDFQNKDEAQTSAWKTNYAINPKLDEYGDGTAEIVDFGIFDQNDLVTATIEKNTPFTLRVRVKFYEKVENPIFTYTWKNIQGVAITGTNTMYERIPTATAEAGDEYEVSFTQNMSLQGGDYLLSISCTGYDSGELCVHHRLYDVVNVTVVSYQNTVGFYDMFSEISVEKNGKNIEA
ncbi:MAG: ABC transporter ATP-binding protein [Lachnospiraceae bacterium]|nr:ABC transporter ATP-binding protein [Lachnospiraceae bacterium]